MKRVTLLLFCLIALLGVNTIEAQSFQANSLKDSVYVYRLTKKQCKKIANSRYKNPKELMTDYVMAFAKDSVYPELPNGNYLTVEKLNNRWELRNHTVGNLYAQKVIENRLHFKLYDSLGVLVPNAKVWHRGHRIYYNRKNNYYRLSTLHKDGSLLIEHDGIYYFGEFDQDSWKEKMEMKWLDWTERLSERRDQRSEKTKSTYGFVAMSKPKYRPNDKVELKLYLEDNRGKRSSKPIDLILKHKNQNYFGMSNAIQVKDSVIARGVKPYRPGMYCYEFYLTDSLNLVIDQDYVIVPMNNGKELWPIFGKFEYTDYDLKNIETKFTANKELIGAGDTLRINLEVVDVSDMPVYGGKANVIIRCREKRVMGKNKVIYIPDTLWSQEINLNNKYKEELLIPGSVFPNDADIDYTITCIYESSNREEYRKSMRGSWECKSLNIEFQYRLGVLDIKAIHFGKQEKVGAIVKHFSSEEVLLSERWVELPYQDTIPWNVEEVNVICDNGYEESYFITTQEIPIALHLTQENNKILIKSENPAQVPFLYTIKRNNRTIAKGYGNELNREWRVRGKQIYSVKLNYLYGDFLYEGPISIEDYIEVSSNKLSVNVESAKRVTPGSKGEIQFTVTDTKGDGVKHADITACGVNAQLKSNVAPTFFLENKGVEPDGWYQDQYTYLELEDFFATFSLQEFMPELLDKEQEENLDFLYPSGVSIKQHVTNDSTTWIWAHVVENGVYKEPILFWIDNLLFATNIFGNSSREQFQITPGLHNLRFLIPGRMVEVENVPIEAGQRNLIIVNGNAEKSETIVPNSALPITTHSERNFIKSFFDLEQSEIEQVMSHFIEIKGAMGYIYLPHSDERFYLPIAIEYAGQYYHVNPYEKGYSEYKRNRDIDSYLVGPFPHLGRDHSEDLEITIYSDTIAMGRVPLKPNGSYELYNDTFFISTIKGYNPNIIKSNANNNSSYNGFYLLSALKKDIVPVTLESISQKKQELVINNSNSTNSIIAQNIEYTKGIEPYTLSMTIKRDCNLKSVHPLFIYFSSNDSTQPGVFQWFSYSHRPAYPLALADMKMTIVMKDSTSYTQTIKLEQNSNNYIVLDSICTERDSILTKKLLADYRSLIEYYPINYHHKRGIKRGAWNRALQQPTEECVVGVIYYNQNKERLAKVENLTNGEKTMSNQEGEFCMPMQKGDTIQIINKYNTTYKSIYNGGDTIIVILSKPSEVEYDEALVLGYSCNQPEIVHSYMASCELVSGDNVNRKSLAELLEGEVLGLAATNASVRIRGIGSVNSSSSPIYVVDGVIVSGDITTISPDDIDNIAVLNADESMQLYGSRAPGGAIIITSYKGAKNNAETGVVELLGEVFPDEGRNSMRRNFNDVAFELPNIKTDKAGKATVNFTYPDNITQWNGYFIAVGNKKQQVRIEFNNTKSLLDLSARLSMPKFTIEGDSMVAIGQVVNYLSDSITLSERCTTPTDSFSNSIEVDKSHVQYIPVTANATDSLTVSYSIVTQSGYFDGEERTIPILAQGIEINKGTFRIIDNNTPQTLPIDSNYGNTQLFIGNMLSSVIDTELDLVINYIYDCNEQITSKIGALLLKRYYCISKGEPFGGDKELKKLIKLLVKNQNDEHLWGWWGKSRSSEWISYHVITQLLNAQEAGYRVDLDFKKIGIELERQSKQQLSRVRYNANKELSNKCHLLQTLQLLKRLGVKTNYEQYYNEVVTLYDNTTIEERLLEQQTLFAIGLADKMDKDSLLKDMKESLLGSYYWSDEQNKGQRLFSPIPYQGAIFNSLLGYELMKQMGVSADSLAKMQNYFFEMKAQQGWNNTYERYQIAKQLLPDLMKDEETVLKSSAIVNGKTIHELPYSVNLGIANEVTIERIGQAPLFVATYQHNFVSHPNVERNQGFEIESQFVQNSAITNSLTAGEKVELEIKVKVAQMANYVMIEVPIPAGCSYNKEREECNKNEIHREYYKDRVVIFCDQLTEGEHIFTISLLPRFSGAYHLNPAKIELMYFPIFYGNNSMKQIKITE